MFAIKNEKATEANIKTDLVCNTTMLSTIKENKIIFRREIFEDRSSINPQPMTVGIKDKASSAGNFPQFSANAGIDHPNIVTNPLARAAEIFFDKT